MSQPPTTKLPLLAAFVLSTAIGGTVTWQLSRPAPRRAAEPTLPSSITLPAWSTQAGASPVLLAEAQSRASIDGLLGLDADYAARVDTLRALLVVLPDKSYPRLLSGLAAQDNADSRRLLDVALRTWIDLDPAAAARWAVLNNQSADIALRAWVKADPVAASEWLGTVNDPEQLKKLSGITLPALFEQDPDRALALAMAMPEKDRANVLRSLMQKMAKTDPAGTILRFAPGLWDNGKGHNLFSSALREWAKTDPRAAISWMVSQPWQHDHQLGHYLGNLVSSDKSDWQRIATIILEIPGIPNRQRNIASMLSRQGRENPAEVISFLDSIGDPHLRNRLLLAMSNSYSDNSVDKSLTLALALPESVERTQRFNWLLSMWAKKDPTAALDWMSAHDDPGVAFASSAVQTGILTNIAQVDPVTAVAEWSAIEDADVRKNAMQPIAHEWAKTAPAAAVQWLFAQQLELLPEEHRPYIFGNSQQMIFNWRKKDPDAALRWVEQSVQTVKAGMKNPEQMMRSSHQNPFKALGGDWDETADRDSTAQLLTKINDSGLRTEALTDHLRNWLKFDRKSATAWLEKNNALTAEQAAKLIAESEKTSP